MVGAVVVVVVGAAVVAVDAPDPLEVDEPLVVDDVEVEPAAVEVVALADDEVDVDPVDVGAEWATVSDATSTPSPAAPAAATTPMAVVIRRTLTMARSRANPAEGLEPVDRPERG